jgi:hypothetical protein
MAKPVLSSITPFDVADGTVIKFAYSGAQPYSNKITVYKATNLSVVYENTETTMQLRHTIPPNSGLVNGMQYAVEVTCYDNDGNPSTVSNKAFFWCLTKPVFYFTSITDGKTYDTSSITADIYYDQEQWDDLTSYRFYLYNSLKEEIFATDIMYDADDITYTFKGLDNLSSYFVRCEGVSQKGVAVDTGYVQFFINYENPTSYARLYVTARDGNGVVDYFTNLIVIEDTSGKEYQYSNSYIILEDDILTYDTNVLIDGDFTMAIKHTYATGTIMRCENENRGFELQIVETEEDAVFRYKLVVPNSVANYILYSEPFTMDGLTVCTCWIRRINNVYQIVFYARDDFTENTNMWLYDTRPRRGVANYDVWIDMERKQTFVAKDDVVIYYQDGEPNEADEDNIWIGGGGFSV